VALTTTGVIGLVWYAVQAEGKVSTTFRAVGTFHALRSIASLCAGCAVAKASDAGKIETCNARAQT
jgi:hypothetical protein